MECMQAVAGAVSCQRQAKYSQSQHRLWTRSLTHIIQAQGPWCRWDAACKIVYHQVPAPVGQALQEASSFLHVLHNDRSSAGALRLAMLLR